MYVVCLCGYVTVKLSLFFYSGYMLIIEIGAFNIRKERKEENSLRGHKEAFRSKEKGKQAKP